jgi:hypothetical protein
MNRHHQAHQQDRIEEQLRQTLPPMPANAEPARDLWPELLRRIDAAAPEPTFTGFGLLDQPWFDGALVAGLVVFAVSVPASIPVLLYYL